ncbi:octopine transport system permease protein OccM [Pleomorphomonas sp. SM30]|uniref:Amino acid ABC transporter membrane protein 2 (PAAT family) n=1 Tax=Oharaeibacter diazotrophicus TaxID=1920512 RepID=A0A4R6RAU1_9HYPH|nr:amino acid ABC transporter membrane protein 2 (PAAT family) [Oharaeibacter diazotrophicus]BBE71979.1 octopine transport system permease protein OccM [Pleomorphomonas sp. SM30]GLS78742.1 nopaline transport system permease protein NocM [Oharaeibacter diazotrophicus]
MIDWTFLAEVATALAPGIPLTLELAAIAVVSGFLLAAPLAFAAVHGGSVGRGIAAAYVFVFRGSPLLVQIFLIYYGLGQFRPFWQQVGLWGVMREPWWCAILALTLNTAAYGSEVLRGALLSVPHGQIEAARACGMSGPLLLRRIVAPIALRAALPGYGNEIVLMVKGTALASVITLMEVTGIAGKLIAETFRAVEVFVVAGAIYLAINVVLTRAIAALETRLMRHHLPFEPPEPAGDITHG